MKRLGFVLFAVVTGCIDSSEELIDASLADESIDDATITTDDPAAHVVRDLDPQGVRCGVPAPPPLEAAWVWGDNGIPIGLQVELVEPIDALTVEFQVHNGATIDALETHRVEVEGPQVFALSARTLEEAADFAVEGGAPFGSLSATVTARDAAGEAVAVGNASTVHFKRDRLGMLVGFSPRAAAAALQDAYPETVVVEGAGQTNTYVRVYRSNPGE